MHVREGGRESNITVGAALTIVTTDEGVAVLGLELAVDVLLSLLHRNVHVPVETREHPCEQSCEEDAASKLFAAPSEHHA